MKQFVRSGSPYEEIIGFSRAVRCGDRIVVSGTAPVPKPGEALAPDARGQMLRCAEIILDAIREAGGAPEHVVRTRMYITDARDADAIGRAHKEAFGAARPAATMVVVAGLLDPGWKIELEAEAIVLVS